MMTNSRKNSPEGEAFDATSFERKINRAKITMLAERIWPRLWLPMGIVGLFVMVSTFGLWPWLPAFLHMALLLAFAVALYFSFRPVLQISRPERAAAIRWLEKKSGLAHRPATVFDDKLPEPPAGTTKGSPQTPNPLWQAHKQRAINHVKAMKTGLPHPKTALSDPYALRVPLVLALAATIGLRADQLGPGLQQAFSFLDQNPSVNLRIDAWITPPPYTARPPLMLVDGARSSLTASTASTTIRATSRTIPEMSELVVRVSGANAPDIRLEFVRLPLQKPADGTSGDTTKTTPLKEATTPLKIKRDGIVRDLRTYIKGPVTAQLFIGRTKVKEWPFLLLKDTAPTIQLVNKPQPSARASLRISYKVSDDYGVVTASAHITKPVQNETDPFGHEASSPRAPSSPTPDNLSIPLGKPPVFPLLLPGGNTKKGATATYKDLTAHPWAGLDVELVLTAKDAAGKTGKSRIAKFRLPERKFIKPLARALIGQRRILAETPIEFQDVASVLDQLTKRSVNSQNPDMTSSVYLGLRSTYWRLRRARTRATIRSVVDQLWDIALTIEDGNLSKAERKLRSAQDRLMDALSRKASEKEIAKLMKELRQALADFLRAMAQNQQKQQQNADQKATPGNQRTLSARELDKMLRDIENMAKTGARDAAKQMLGQMRELLENLNRGGPPQPSKQAKEMRKQLDQLGKMIMKQRKLLDETHQKSQQNNQRAGAPQQQGQRQGQQQREGQGRRPDKQDGQRRGIQPGQKQGRGQQPGNQQGRGAGHQTQKADAQKLKNRQGQLLEGLIDLMDKMRGAGMRVPQDLMRAGSHMGQAEQKLGRQQLRSAKGQQGKALGSLRKGAREMAEQMMKQSKGQQAGRQNRDPLGRNRRSSGPEYGQNVKVPRKIDTRRARDILEELRRRLGQSTRPAEELDYLERLIEQF